MNIRSLAEVDFLISSTAGIFACLGGSVVPSAQAVFAKESCAADAPDTEKR